MGIIGTGMRMFGIAIGIIGFGGIGIGIGKLRSGI